jgi:hypothetical protein
MTQVSEGQRPTPAQARRLLTEGNRRFVAGRRMHPNQDEVLGSIEFAVAELDVRWSPCSATTPAARSPPRSTWYATGRYRPGTSATWSSG